MQGYVNGFPLISGSAPIFENSNSSGKLLGVIVADTALAAISDYLSEFMPVGQTGVAYIYEKNEMLIAASKGEIAVRIGQKYSRITVSNSSDPTIRKSQRFLHSQIGSEIWSHTPVTFDGNALEDAPMQATTAFRDPNGISWLITVMAPAADYYGFIQDKNLWITLAAVVLAGLCTCALILSSLWITPTLRGLVDAQNRAIYAVAVTAAICVFLYIL